VTEDPPCRSGAPRRRAFLLGCLAPLGWLAPLGCLALALLAVPAAAVERIVSLNLCSDQMLVLLAPEKVAALSPLARDPALSFVAARAAALPVVRASAEAVLRLHPDLVLAGTFGAQTTLALLTQEGVPVWRLDMPQDFAAIRTQTTQLAVRLGVPERGAALIAAMDATLRSVPPPLHPISAVAWEPRGYTAGPGSLMDAVLRAAGLVNASGGRRLGLEALLRHPPDLLVVQEAAEYPSLATEMLESPAVAAIPRRTLPPPLTICAGPFTAQAVTLLAR
jgi:iron complex transport system substrate-binding protein